MLARRKRLRNKPIRSLPKTNITKAEKLIGANDAQAAEIAVVAAVSSLDKAARKGIIHPNNAARRKSRLAKKLNSINASTPQARTEELAEAQTEEPAKPQAETSED